MTLIKKKNEENISNRNMEIVSGINPAAVWHHFKTLCEIPRESGNEEKVAAKIVEIATEQGYEVVVEDKLHNVLIRIPATADCEQLPLRLIQGHLDMVCVKDKGIQSVFPVELGIDEGVVFAKGTTGGFDNGLGIAMKMALMTEKDIPHGPIELFFTTDEERGMDGANGFDYSLIKSSQIINLDSEEKNTFFVGCAGGIRMKASLPICYSEKKPQSKYYEIGISGLKGGHSGLEIHLGHANAIIALAKVISELKPWGCRIASFEGGVKMNTIPFEAKAVVAVPIKKGKGFCEAFEQAVETVFSEWKNETPTTNFKNVSGKKKVFTQGTQDALMEILKKIPNGVITMGDNDVVETSNSIGLVVMTEDSLEITTMFRSSVNAKIDTFEETTTQVFEDAGASAKTESKYYAWVPKTENKLLDLAVATFKETFNSEPQVKIIHAGLECAVIQQKLPDAEIISFGPQIDGAHTTKERVDVASVENAFILLTKLLVTQDVAVAAEN